MNVVEIGKKVFSSVNACGLQMPTKCSPENVEVIYVLSFSKQIYTIMVKFYRDIIL